MLRKLLKYDFKSISKLWIILTVTIFGLSFPVGYAIKASNQPREIPVGIEMLSFFGTMILVFGIFAYTILIAILIFRRFYKNFFTDEGYLTFTLPAQRKQLLSSKLIFGTLTQSATMFVYIATLFNLINITNDESIITTENLRALLDTLNISLGMGTGVSILYIVALILLVIAAFIFANCISVAFLYLCITIASIIAKKNKVLTSVAIYYFSNSALSFIFMIFALFGIGSLTTWLSTLTPHQGYIFILLTFVLICIFLAIVSVVLYLILFRLLDKKLNLT